MGRVAWGLLLSVPSSKVNYLVTMWLLEDTSRLICLSASRDQGQRIRGIRVSIRASVTSRNRVELDLGDEESPSQLELEGHAAVVPCAEKAPCFSLTNRLRPASAPVGNAIPATEKLALGHALEKVIV